MSSSPKIHRPKPRRPFETSSTTEDSASPFLSPIQPDETPSRTHSILNLTSSTLLGIYAPTYDNNTDTQPSTPWGAGAESPRNLSFSSIPVRRKSTVPPPKPKSIFSTILALGLRGVLLFGMGMGYGVLVRHLHDDAQLAPFQVEGIIKPQDNWRYLLFWGIAGVALGSLLPWVDTLFTVEKDDSAVFERKRSSSPGKDNEEDREGGLLGADWTPVIRSVGAFVGIAYAIRKLPWASTLQASLTLALVNPVLWYLVDRSKPGFLLSTAVGATGTALLLASNPDMMPSPASASFGKFANGTLNRTEAIDGSVLGWVSREGLEGGIWILSVLFCSCVCFGNIGRRLALSGRSTKLFAKR